MTTLRSSFRKWWRPPRKASERDLDRSVTFLELFYDLVYVVLVAQLAHALAENVTWKGVAGYAFLFFIVWWVYFDFVSHRKPLATMSKVSQWFYLHLPMTAGIAAAGAAVFNVVEHSGELLEAGVRWLLVGSVSLVLVCVALLMQSIQLPEEHFQLYRRGGLVTIGSALLILLLGFFNLPIIPLLIILALLMLVPVLYGIMVWIQVLGAEEIPIH
jgi:low temperature requirement protein LtrA